MRKKIILLTLVILSLLIIKPINIKAIEDNSYINIKDTENLDFDKISLSNLSFKDYTQTSVKAFGLSGTITNKTNETISYISTVEYYDASYNLIAENRNSKNIIPGDNNFDQMANSNILESHNTSEISYYKISIEAKEKNDISGILPSKDEKYKYNPYVIDKYDVNIVVKDNNSYDIIETITAYFNTPKHGIIRSIPLSNTVKRLDGSTSTNHPKITNVSVDNEYTTSRESGNYKLKIGSANKTITGEQKYVIKYNYNLGKDHVKNYDELYLNIIGAEWDTVIGNITFTIVMPKEFDSSKLGFSSGSVGSTDNSNIKYTISDNTISGYYNGVLNKNEALTVRCELPEGYFANAKSTTNPLIYALFTAPLIFLGIAIFLWNKYGRDDEVIETVEFYPPKGINSLEAGFLYNGSVNNKDITSLLIYLANKGYIKITEIEEKGLFGKSKGFRITKLKEYDGTNEEEKLFLKGLFKKKHYTNVDYKKVRELMKEAKSRGEKIDYDEICKMASDDKDSAELESVTKDDLYDNFYKTMNKIKSNTEKKKNIVFEKSSLNKVFIVVLLAIISFVIITIPAFIELGATELLPFALIFPGLGFAMILNALVREFPEVGKAFSIIFGGIFGGMPFALIVLPVLKESPICLIGYIFGIICIIGISICAVHLPKRTSYGNEMLGKLKGFKNFLETAEKEKLEAMVMEDPTYFYNILPYTYVFGISDKWIKKFETIALQAPTWYEGTDNFNMTSFSNFMDSTMSSATSAMSSSPSDSSGSSGGGSSGGGSGGGGGSSW